MIGMTIYLFPEAMDARLHCPFVMQVVGPSQSGKSSFVGRLLKESSLLFDRAIDRLTWISPHGHLPDELTSQPLPFKLEVVTALSDEDLKFIAQEKDDEEAGEHHVVVIDDFAGELKNSSTITNLYTKGSHHRGITLIQVLQTLFLQSKEARTRSLNIHYLVLMRQTRDISQIRVLASQVTSNALARRGFLDAYEDAVTQRPYAYLLITFHPKAPRDLFLRTNIFPDEKPHNVVYSLPGTSTAATSRAPRKV